MHDMLKYADTMVTFAEVPDEVALCINISGCQQYCEGCHSPHLAENIGQPLTKEALKELAESNKGITCIALMGGDHEPETINKLAYYIHNTLKLKVCWYSGLPKICKDVDWTNFDYVKVGNYRKKLGGLDNPKSNQRFWRLERRPTGRTDLRQKAYHVTGYDITYRFNGENKNGWEYKYGLVFE